MSACLPVCLAKDDKKEKGAYKAAAEAKVQLLFAPVCSCLLSAVYSLISAVCCLLSLLSLSALFSLLSALFYLLPATCYRCSI
jgi:hypothetical protein